MSSIRFENPLGLLMFLPIILLALYYVYMQKSKSSGVKLTGINAYKSSMSFKVIMHYLSVAIIFIGLLIATFSIVKPQYGSSKEMIEYTGIDIMISLDISPSMLATDYGNFTRLDIAKYFTGEFIKKRKGDRIGLVTFSTNSYLKAPATNNSDLLLDILKHLDVVRDKRATTSIGLGMASAINRLRSIKDNENTDSKIIILITDGENNSGEITPETATDIAKKIGIKVYTVGIGNVEELDMSLLENIAKTTGGQFFYARTSTEINDTFDTIDSIEKQKLQKNEFTQYNSIGYYFAIIGIILLSIGLIFYTFVFRRLG